MTRDNHGHVKPRPDGTKELCGGTRLCHTCRREFYEVQAEERRKQYGIEGRKKP